MVYWLPLSTRLAYLHNTMAMRGADGLPKAADQPERRISQAPSQVGLIRRKAAQSARTPKTRVSRREDTMVGADESALGSRGVEESPLWASWFALQKMRLRPALHVLSGQRQEDA